MVRQGAPSRVRHKDPCPATSLPHCPKDPLVESQRLQPQAPQDRSAVKEPDTDSSKSNYSSRWP